MSRPIHPLPLRAEIRRQARRRRTWGTFAVLIALPLILVAAFAIGDDDAATGQRTFVDLAQQSGANLVVFTLFASTGFLLIVITGVVTVAVPELSKTPDDDRPPSQRASDRSPVADTPPSK